VKKKKIIFIINPKSGVLKSKNLPKQIDLFIDKSIFDYQIFFTQRAGHATELAKNAVDDSCEAVIAVGGDGSINEIAKSLVNSNTCLGIIPAGSGNGIARSLGIPMQIEKALLVVNNFKVKKIDTGFIDSNTFIGIAGIGFDAHISQLFMFRKKRGFANYIKLVFFEFWNFKSNHLLLSVDGKEIFNGQVFTAVAANMHQYGNNAYIAPLALCNDGILNFTIVKKISIKSAPQLIYRLFNGTILKSKYVISATGKTAEFKTDSIYYHKDGEAVLVDKVLKVNVNPSSLNIITL
jgi:diacylglycerol kinase (ATP)